MRAAASRTCISRQEPPPARLSDPPGQSRLDRPARQRSAANQESGDKGETAATRRARRERTAPRLMIFSSNPSFGIPALISSGSVVLRKVSTEGSVSSLVIPRSVATSGCVAVGEK